MSTMMLKMTIKDILKQPVFAGIAIVSGFIIGLLYYFLTLSSAIAHFDVDISIMPVYIAASIILTFIVAVLGGINISLVVYNIKTQRANNIKKSGSSAIFGGMLTAFTPGCPACTTSLSALFGIIGGLAIFPLQGLELKLISIGALTYSIWWAMRNINNSTCCVMKE